MPATAADPVVALVNALSHLVTAGRPALRDAERRLDGAWSTTPDGRLPEQADRLGQAVIRAARDAVRRLQNV